MKRNMTCALLGVGLLVLMNGQASAGSYDYDNNDNTMAIVGTLLGLGLAAAIVDRTVDREPRQVSYVSDTRYYERDNRHYRSYERERYDDDHWQARRHRHHHHHRRDW